MQKYIEICGVDLNPLFKKPDVKIAIRVLL